MIIAIIGGDGVGKSSVAKSLVSNLKKNGKSAEFCSSFEDYFFLGFLLRLFSSKRNKAAADFRGEDKVEKKSWVFVIWPYLILLDQFLLFLYLKVFKGSQIVVGDRYAYSYLVTWKYYGYSNKLLEWLYLLFPKPDIAFIIDLPADVAYSRKLTQAKGVQGVYNDEFFDFHIKEYDELAKRFGIEKIDNRSSLDETANHIAQQVKEYLKND